MQIISQLSTWMITEVQKLIRIAKKIIHEGKMKKKRMKETIAILNQKDRYVHTIIPATFMDTHRTSTHLPLSSALYPTAGH